MFGMGFCAKFIRDEGRFSAEMTLSTLSDALLTVPEAARLAGVSPKFIQQEVDERVVPAAMRDGRRSISGADLLYLVAMRKLRGGLAPRFRRQLRNSIALSASQNRASAELEWFVLPLERLGAEILAGFRALQRTKLELIETRSDVLAGEPVLRGTRLSARFIAELVRRGSTAADLAADYDLTFEQIEAAVLFDAVTPKVGRPRGRSADLKVTAVEAAASSSARTKAGQSRARPRP